MDVKTVQFTPFQDQKPGTHVLPSPSPVSLPPTPPCPLYHSVDAR